MRILLAMQAEAGAGLKSAENAAVFQQAWQQVRADDEFTYVPVSPRPADFFPYQVSAQLPPLTAECALRRRYLARELANSLVWKGTKSPVDCSYASSPWKWGRSIGAAITAGYRQIVCMLPATYCSGQKDFTYRNGDRPLTLTELASFPESFCAGLYSVLSLKTPPSQKAKGAALIVCDYEPSPRESLAAGLEEIKAELSAAQANKTQGISTQVSKIQASSPQASKTQISKTQPLKAGSVLREGNIAGSFDVSPGQDRLSPDTLKELSKLAGGVELRFYVPQSLSLAGAEGLLPQLAANPEMEPTLKNLANEIYQRFSTWAQAIPQEAHAKREQLLGAASALTLPGSASGGTIAALGAILGGKILPWPDLLPEDIDSYDLVITYQDQVSSWTLPDSPLELIGAKCVNAPVIVWTDRKECGERELADWGIDGAYQLKTDSSRYEIWQDAGKRCAYNWGH